MAKLGDYISIKHGYAFKGDGITTEDNGIVLVTPGNFAIGGGFKEEKCKFFKSEYPSDYILSEDDLVITMTDLSKEIDTLGYSALIPKSKRIYLHNQRIGLVNIASADIDKHYLYWFMRTRNYQRTIAGGASGTTVHHTSPSRICEVEVDFPDLLTQKKIAGLMDNIEGKIQKNKEINNHLEQVAQALYSEMFITGLNDSFHAGELSDIAEITMGQSPKGDTYNENGVGTVFYQGRAEFGDRFPSCRLFTTDPKRMAQPNDVLMSVRAPVGDLNVAYEECCIGRGLSALHSRDNHQSFVLYTMHSLREQLNVFNGEGTVFGSINRKDLNAMPINIPPQNLMDQFEDQVAPIDAAIRVYYEENVQLKNIRDALLPRLMSGEMDVSVLDL